MKNQILELLRQKPQRLTSLGSSLHIWHIKLLPYITELEKENKIYTTEYKDMANMENYLIYHIRE